MVESDLPWAIIGCFYGYTASDQCIFLLLPHGYFPEAAVYIWHDLGFLSVKASLVFNVLLLA
jgi:hypothetical protein